jgi:hypothetical protein
LLVRRIRATHYAVAIPKHFLDSDRGPPQIVLCELKSVMPSLVLNHEVYGHHDVRLLSGVKTTKLRNTTARPDGPLEPSFRISDLAQESNAIQKIRLPRRIGSNDKPAPVKRHVDMPEVLPVLKLEAIYPHT